MKYHKHMILKPYFFPSSSNEVPEPLSNEPHDSLAIILSLHDSVDGDMHYSQNITSSLRGAAYEQDSRYVIYEGRDGD